MCRSVLAHFETPSHSKGMIEVSHSADLTGKILIAMPGMGDPRFEKTVIYMCAHSPDGSMGLIVNKPSLDISFAELVEQLSIDPAGGLETPTIHFGGPVELGRGFVLHSGEYAQPNGTLKVNSDFGMTASLEVLEDIAFGGGPERFLIALGYSGWGPGQLDAEIAQNGWLTADASTDLIFGTVNSRKWTLSLQKIGIDPLLLSATGGSA